MNCIQRQKLVDAVEALKNLSPINTLYDGLSLPNYEDFTEVHLAAGGIAHGDPRFLPSYACRCI